MKILLRAACAAAILLALACSRQSDTGESPSADRAYLNGVIYTADAGQRVVSALAVAGERIVYVGDDAGVRDFIGADTEVTDLQGRMLLPGLHDMHIHPMGIVDDGGCDIESEPLNLAAISELVKGCIAQRELEEGAWLSVDQWNFAVGNQPAGGFANIRQALDAVAPDHPVILWGNDGHHGAVNSAALARAVNEAGVMIGITAQSLRNEFAEYREVIGVDASGEPNGELHETARDLVRPPSRRLLSGLPPEGMQAMARKLAENGITTIQDAATPPESLDAYRGLMASGDMHFNLSTAMFLDVDAYRRDEGTDVAAMVATLQSLRDSLADMPLIQLDTAKIFVDGVLEGNPLNDPPTLPNAAVLSWYKQPRFDIDMAAGRVEITGYVDTASELCASVRDDMDAYLQPEAMGAFHQKHGFYPQQCRLSRGVLEHPAAFVHDYMRALDAAGFKIHAHVIGDRAVRTALDGFEALRAANGDSGLRHSLAHIHLVAPEDYRRIGDLGLYLVFTYAWALPDYFYDLTVIPFIDQLGGVQDLYRADGYYMANVYPVAQLRDLGAVLASGSDAPVDTREPRPFVNIQLAVSRADETGRVLNPAARVDIRTALDAYTINGARLFGHEQRTGSLEAGKYADLVVVDRDLIGLAESGRASEIADARVMLTLFRGAEVYRAN